MGVPKFFRWLSERYPLINQRYHSPSDYNKMRKDGDSSSSSSSDDSDSDSSGSDSDSNNTQKAAFTSFFTKSKVRGIENLSNDKDLLKTSTLAPKIDRLYIDMNGIIHGCSHNNSEEDGSVTQITHQEIFDNITHYLDRVIGDVVQPQQLVYMAIDGVAPRAKLNQQRSRRYRSGTGQEIEQTVYEAHLETLQKERQEANEAEAFEQALKQKQQKNVLSGDMLDLDDTQQIGASLLDGFESGETTHQGGQLLTEVEPGRFTGKFETQLGGDGTSLLEEGEHPLSFHSNSITPGTPFFKECTDHLEAYIRDRLANDPKWQHLTIVFSGPNVPGEGEHKIMDFMRMQKKQPDYDPNLRHCIQGQDGDLIMLGLVTHEPNLVLFREQVIFDARRRRAVEGLGVDGYVHNPNFEFLHMNVLRDYLAFDFETSNVVAESPFDLERTIDDFVLMTFFVGNDFLPAMPALDIADEAFDLLWYTYREQREKWFEESQRTGVEPYLTDAGSIVSGKRLEAFLSEVGSFESPYFDNKKEVEKETNERIRKYDRKFGEETIPDEEVLESKEEADRANFRQMMKERREALKEAEGGDFDPVLSSPTPTNEAFQPSEENDEQSPRISKRLGNLLKQSVSEGSLHEDEDEEGHVVVDDTDIKGRYYYDKFKFTPFDAAEHKALRKAYIEGLVWNLKYYYEGCVSWSWYYPFHYGPMLSDLVGIDSILKEVSFEGRLGEPLMPFEQLMACMPPSQAHMLPEPYRPLMTDTDSTIIDFYPKAFTVDMNGKRWPWEAVVLLPFIDTQRLLECTRNINFDELSEVERERNQIGKAMVMTNNSLDGQGLDEESTSLKVVPFESTDWQGETGGFQSALKSGIQVPLPGLPSLRNAPIRSLWRRRMGLNVFGLKSRYKTACLEHSESMPALPPLATLGETLIGTTIWINFPHLTEAFVTAVSDENHTIRGTEGTPQKWSKKDQLAWVSRRDDVVDAYERGQGFTGTGGLLVSPDQNVLLSVRPLKGLREMPDGAQVKTFCKQEIDVPIVATLWAPLEADPRLATVPALVEKNPYKFHGVDAESKKKVGDASKGENLEPKKGSKKSTKQTKRLTRSKGDDVIDMFAPPRDEAAITLEWKEGLTGGLTGSKGSSTKGRNAGAGSILPMAPPIDEPKDKSETTISEHIKTTTSKPPKAPKKSSMESILPDAPASIQATEDANAAPILPNVPGVLTDSKKRNGEMRAGLLEKKTRNEELQSASKRNGELRTATEKRKRNGELRPKDLDLFPSTPNHEYVWLPVDGKAPTKSTGSAVSTPEELALFPPPPPGIEEAPILEGCVFPPPPPGIEEAPILEGGDYNAEKNAGLLEEGANVLTRKVISARQFAKGKIPAEEKATRTVKAVKDKVPLKETRVVKKKAKRIIKATNYPVEDQIVKASNKKWWESTEYKKQQSSASRQQFSTWSQPKKWQPSHPALTSSRQYSTLARPKSLGGGGRGRFVAAGVAAAAILFASGANAAAADFGVLGGHSVGFVAKSLLGRIPRGGIQPWLFENEKSYFNDDSDDSSNVPPLEFEHGTTTLSFAFQGGAIVAVDSRASLGSFVGSKTVQKVLPINSHMLGTMAGGAADCSYLIRSLRSEAMRFELEEGRRISTARISSLLARTLYSNRGMGLSVGTMIVGYDDLPAESSSAGADPQIYYVDDSGTRLKGKLFSAGSGSTFALAILDTEFRYDLSQEEAIALGIKAIRYATLRDAFSGGFINVYLVTREEGWKKVFTQDVAAVAPSNTGNETILEKELT